MATKTLTLRNGDKIKISALPVQLIFPAFSPDEIQTGIVVTQNGTAVDVSKPINVLPTDAISIEYVTVALPSVTVTGTDIFSAYLDGKEEVVTPAGTVSFVWSGKSDDHEIIVQGRQLQPLTLSFTNNGSSEISVDGQVVENNSTMAITKDVHIDAKATPIPVHFEIKGTPRVQVNGAVQTAQDFTLQIQSPTEIDIESATCELTIDYGDNSYSLTVPQAIITICAPHRDWWLFDTWSSPDVGIESPKLVRTVVDLQGVESATLVAHYQKFPAWDKPNFLN